MRQQILNLIEQYLPGPFKLSGESHVMTICPFHKGGQEKRPSFGVNLDKGLYHCFTCQAAGNIQKLLKEVGVSKAVVDMELAVIKPILDKNLEKLRIEKQYAFSNRDPFKADYILPEALLGVYEFLPLSLIQKGFSEDILSSMEIGYDRVNHRITYPLRDMYGNLAGISGGATSPTQYPKYKVYQGRRRANNNHNWIPGDFGSWFDEQFPEYRCENHDFLWNFERVYPNLLTNLNENSKVFLVEGFKACLWLVQHGITNVVALMGSYISERQQHMLHRLGSTIVLFLDNDDAGKEATFKVGDYLWRPMYGKIEVIAYPIGEKNTQPDDYQKDVLLDMVNNPTPFLEYLNLLRRGYYDI